MFRLLLLLGLSGGLRKRFGRFLLGGVLILPVAALIVYEVGLHSSQVQSLLDSAGEGALVFLAAPFMFISLLLAFFGAVVLSFFSPRSILFLAVLVYTGVAIYLWKNAGISEIDFDGYT